ncbi:MAG: YkgJ family cysteine cluster protein [Deltaproteobacteria bacterium]|nr:YkgJ family cysteine cluster protein [Deltaproteobacteria bacterium]
MARKLTSAQQAKRDAKRERRAEARTEPEAAPRALTFGEVIRNRNLVWSTSKATRTLIRDTEAYTREAAKVSLQVVSCFDCNATKACCSVVVGAYFHEVVPIVDRLRKEGRDTPELRAELAAAADEMETRSPDEYRRPCALLDAQERCTVYDQRPAECGTTFVSSPAMQCSDPDASVQKYLPPYRARSQEAERVFESEARLIPLRGPYVGALPRMVLLCLEAWDRSDYAQFLAEQIPIVAQRAIAAVARRT